MSSPMHPASNPLPQPPGLSLSRPRPVRLNSSGWVVLVLGVVFTLGSLVTGLAVYSLSRQRLELVRRARTESVITQGVVTRLDRTREKNPRHRVHYAYTAGGRTYHSRIDVSPSLWQSLRPGATLPVVYLASNPARSWLPGHEPRPLPLWVAPLASVGLALLAALCWRELARQYRLLAEGRLTEAVVVSQPRRRYESSRKSHWVRYEFRTLAGTLVQGRFSASGAPPHPGTRLPILYDPDNPSRSAPYPLALVRPG